MKKVPKRFEIRRWVGGCDTYVVFSDASVKSHAAVVYAEEKGELKLSRAKSRLNKDADPEDKNSTLRREQY